MMHIIKKDELDVEGYLAKLQHRFQAIMDRDSQIPHAKFLFVVQRLNERYMTILRDVEKRQTIEQISPETLECRRVCNANYEQCLRGGIDKPYCDSNMNACWATCPPGTFVPVNPPAAGE